MTLAGLARILDGKVIKGAVIAPLPGPTFRQIRVVLSPQAPDGFYALPNDGSRATSRECRQYVERRLAMPKKERA
jgi:hypothetical protein